MSRLFLIPLLFLPAAAAAEFTLDLDLLEHDTRALASGPHRLASTPAFHEAIDYLQTRLREVGVEDLFVQTFRTTQLVNHGAEIRLHHQEDDAGPLPLVPLRPNGIVPAATSAEGITGRLVYVGRATQEEMGDSLEGAIAVLDYESGENWLRVFRKGAAAAIFLPAVEPRSDHQHHVFAPVPIPRFYFEGDRSLLTGGGEGTLHAAASWQPAEGRNLIAYLPGHDPQFFLDHPETVVIAVPLDSYGNVPERSAGARKAANAAALIQWAGWFAENRPRRNVVFLFLDQHARGQAGALAYYRMFLHDSSSGALNRRITYNERETRFITHLIELAGAPDPLSERGDVGRDLVRRLRAVADTRTFDLRFAERAEIEAAAAAPDDATRTAFLERARFYESTRAGWNDLKRSLANRRLVPQAEEPFLEALAEVTASLGRRRAELDAERRALASAQAIHSHLGTHQRVLHLTVMAGDGSDRWGLLIGDNANNLRNPRDSFAFYSGLRASFARTANELTEAGSPLPGFLPFTGDGSLFVPRIFFSGPTFVTTGAFAGRVGVPNMALTTGQDRFPREGTPHDTPDRLAFDVLGVQLSEMARLVRHALDQDGLSQRSAIARQDHVVWGEFTGGNERFGPRVMVRRPGRSAANEPMPGAIIQLMMQPSDNPAVGPYAFDPFKFPDYDDFMVIRSDEEGAYHVGPWHDDFGQTFAFGAAFNDRGLVEFASTQSTRAQIHNRINLIPARAAWFVPPPQLTHGNTVPFGSGTNARLDDQRAFHRTFDGVMFVYFEDRQQGIKLLGPDSFALLKLDPIDGLADADRGFFRAHRDYRFGIGVEGRAQFEPPPLAPRAARDLLELNEFRLSLLRSHGVRNPTLETLHLQSRDALEASEEKESSWRSEALAGSAYLFQRHVYRETRGTLQDMVRAVLALLLLTIPFAYAMERLLIGSTNIYRQVMGFVVFFSGTFLLLYFTHPAFSVSATPMVIFLGFGILLMAVLVIALIMEKFERELKTIQGMASTIHSADVSRLGTLLAAVHMGISTMRRRPMRTALTAITVVLLTFTLLTFSSFGSQLGVVKLFRGAAPSYSAISVARTNWGPLNHTIVDLARGLWADHSTIAPRYWVTRDWSDPSWKTSSTGLLATDATQDRMAVLNGMLGLSDAEISVRHDFREALGLDPGERLGERIWLTSGLARDLDVQAGDTIRLGGLALTVGGLLGTREFLSLTDMEGNPVIPVDLSVFDPGQVSAEAEDPGETQNWQYLPVDSVVVTSNEITRRLGGTLRLLHVYTQDADEASRLADEFAVLTNAEVLGTRPDGVYRHVFGTVLQAGGLRELLLPMILGGLVIFGTLLGSVADREREIYTFSALGLAPRHVASLFFAEAMVFAVIGGIAGYLLAQSIAKGIDILATAGLVSPLELNYSSFNAIATLIVVMLVVLASSIYPALKASRSANPGIMRSWKIPPPKGDHWEIIFPFTVSSHDITGVVSFLREHFLNYTDTGMGNFLCMRCELVQSETGSPGVEADLALAPFDLGVTQSFRLESRPSEIAGIDEVHILIERRSGQRGDWKRLNRMLVDDLRRQFLLWRALPHETMENYRLRTLESLGEPAETASAQA
ncbi:MAG: ABC transporter permease [Puniceicoccaceae bacterium]|nr:MAG: ABC transporter permease [Puniceicoccaceae bacterium]